MRLRAVWIAAIVALAAPSAQAAHGPLDTLFVLNSMSLPVLALDPTTGDRHLACLSDGILQHAWETSGVWQTEAVVDSASLTTYTGFQLAIAPDGHPVAAYARKNTFVCAIRGPGGWQRDTLDTLPGPFYPIALALDPATGEPAVAWARKSTTAGVPSQVFYARHAAGAWSTQQVDTTSSFWLNVALGIDDAGRPHLAWARPRSDAQPTTVLVCSSGAGPDGPFSSAPVDSQFASFLSMAVDRFIGEPRLVYVTSNADYTRTVRYGYRVPGGAWQHMAVTYGDGSGNPPGPALALDPAGNPFISLSVATPIEPGVAAGASPARVEGCAVVSSDDVRVFYRAGGAGSAPFGVEYLSFPQHDARSGLFAIASDAIGRAVLAWRTRIGCPPYGLTSTTVTGPSLVGVDGTGASGVARPSVRPNPARRGDPLRVEFTLAREGGVTLELHDLVGRRAAARSLGTLLAGSHAVPWPVQGLSPGLYWLTVRSDAERIGPRAVVILR